MLIPSTFPAPLLLQLPTSGILVHPKDFTGTDGDTITFSCYPADSNATYSWQVKPAGSSTWATSGAAGSNTHTITVEMASSRNGNQYRCIVTDSQGRTYTSDPATICYTRIYIAQQPETVYGDIGDDAEFSLTARGNGLS